MLIICQMLAVVEVGGKEGPTDLVVQLLAYWMDCYPTWQDFKKDTFKNSCQIGRPSIQGIESYY
jgi:hypothetical protein